jgi:hypothetical protein
MRCGALFLLFLAACGGSGAPAEMLSGEWVGPWFSRSGVGGTAKMTLAVDGENVTGMSSFTGSACASELDIQGTFHKDSFFGSLVAGGIRVDISTLLSADQQLVGTYSAVAAGVCTGDTGTLSLRR